MKVFNVFYALLLLVSFISEAAFAQHRPGPGGPGGPGRPGPGGPGPSRPQPGPAPRPQPGPAPRPQPGPAPRPQPGPAPRPQPGPAPRPQPGPAPRPQPAPAPRPQPPMPRPQPSQQQACFYEHDNFQGHAICVNPGSVIYRLSDYGLARRFSSAIIPQGWSVTVYEYDNFGGASLTLYGQIHTLRMYGDYWNDRISSIDFRY